MDENVQRRRVTLEDVAKLAKVSTSAVSRTFTDGASVSKKTRTKVLKAADHLAARDQRRRDAQAAEDRAHVAQSRRRRRLMLRLALRLPLCHRRGNSEPAAVH